MQDLIGAMSDEGEFTTQLLGLLHGNEDTDPQISEFIDRIYERQDEIPITDVPNVIRAFLSAGDRIVEVDDTFGSSFNPIESKIVSFVLALVERIGEEGLDKEQGNTDEKVDILRSAIEDSDSPYLSSYLTVRLLRDHGEHDGEPLPEEDRVIGLEEIDKLKRATDQVIQKHAERGQLLSVPKSGMVLNHWPGFAEADNPEQWARSKMESREEFIDLLGGFLMTSSLRSSGSTEVIDQSYVDPRWLEPYLDLDKIRKRVEEYDPDDLDEHQRRIVETYRTAWEHLDSGDDPGSAETWHF